MYAGPVGWFGGMGSEFAVGIRSSLVESTSNHGNNGMNGIQMVIYDLTILVLLEADLIYNDFLSKIYLGINYVATTNCCFSFLFSPSD